jgi:hypothetical protein
VALADPEALVLAAAPTVPAEAMLQAVLAEQSPPRLARGVGVKSVPVPELLSKPQLRSGKFARSPRGLRAFLYAEASPTAVSPAHTCSMRILSPALAAFLLSTSAVFAEPQPIFDGKSFAGWEGDTKKTWRIVEGALVGGSLVEKVPHNEFLATEKSYRNFDLRLKCRLVGTEGFVNAGIQIRSKRIPNHHEMIGYQADMGEGYWGSLYDESRRNKMLATADKEAVAKAIKKDDWNDYRIRCEGSRIQLWINGVQTVDYTEADEKIEQEGKIAVQIHGDGKAEASYKDIVIEELP